MSGRPACSQCVGELAASVTVPGVVEMVTVVMPVRFVPQCSERAVASECCLGHNVTQRCSSPASTTIDNRAAGFKHSLLPVDVDVCVSVSLRLNVS